MLLVCESGSHVSVLAECVISVCVVHLSVGRNVSLVCESGSPVSVLAGSVISV